MSLADFSAAIQSHAYESWFKRISTSSILKSPTKEIRAVESNNKNLNSFYINEKTIFDVLDSITHNATPMQVEAVFSKLKAAVYDRKRQAKQIAPYSDETGRVLYFPRVSFSMIQRILDESFSELLGDQAISSNFELGHVYGIFPNKLDIVKNSLYTNKTINTNAKKAILDTLDAVEKELYKQDLESSNIKDPKFTLYSKYSKNKSKYLVELQLKSVNQASGKAQSPISVGIRNFFNPTTNPRATSFSGISSNFMRTIIETKGSPSYVDLLVASIKESLLGKKNSNSTYTIPYVKSGEKSTKLDKSEIKNAIKSDIAKLKKLKQSVTKYTGQETPATTSTLGLSRLLAILQYSINDQVAHNMGTGDSKDILNYRTGRFASSVEVQRLTTSREGTISAFYTYMKYPYATFSEGGQQQYPKTRDPKLLIAKSIRDIAARVVTNRMRAVLV